MSVEVQNVATTPVFAAIVYSGKQGMYWSGREDSNLRPLPPEGVAPDLIPLFSVMPPCGDGSLGRLCSRRRIGRRFKANLGALSFIDPRTACQRHGSLTNDEGPSNG